MHVPLVDRLEVLWLELWPNNRLQGNRLRTCILEVSHRDIVSKSTFAKDSHPLCHEDVVRSLEGLSHIHKDCHSSPGFNVCCHLISDHQLGGNPILRPCGELEHTGWHLGWQGVELIDQVKPGCVLIRKRSPSNT